jgi:hypothetical protein
MAKISISIQKLLKGAFIQMYREIYIAGGLIRLFFYFKNKESKLRELTSAADLILRGHA